MSVTPRNAALADAARSLRAPLLVVLAYLLLRALLAALAGHNGIFTPDGHVSPALIVLTMSVLVLRLVALFVVPALIVYRLIARAIEHFRA